jgi:hypothetical protein
MFCYAWIRLSPEAVARLAFLSGFALQLLLLELSTLQPAIVMIPDFLLWL